MYKHGYLLKTDADFFNAILLELVVTVTKDGEHNILHINRTKTQNH
jgi:hypothetical protein